MKQVNIKKSESPPKIRSVEIVIDGEIRSFDSLDEQDLFMTEQAAQIEEALFGSLPGGTYDRLAYMMMKRKVSLFIVSHSSFER